MKSIFITLLLALGATAPIVVGAQAPAKSTQNAPAGKKAVTHLPKTTPEQRADTTAARLTRDLNLSPDQHQKVHDLALTREQKMDDLRKQYEGQDPAVWADQRKKVQQEFRDGMKSTLTADQYAQWEQMKKEHHKAQKQKQRAAK